MTNIRNARRTTRRLLAATAALALLAAACGSDDATSEPAGTEAASTDASGTDPAGTEVASTDPAGSEVAGTEPAGSAPAAGGAVFDQALFDLLPADIQESGVLTLATDPTDPPLEFFDENNEIVGAEVDVAAALGVVLGIEVKLEESKFDAIIPGVEAGRFDGSLSGFADRVERQEIVDFVDFFTSSRGYLIQTGTHPELAAATDLCGLTVAVAKGTTMADAISGLSDTCSADGKDPIDGQILPDQAATVLAVQSGRADLTILSDHAALAIAQSSDGELDVVLRPNEGQDINGILLRKGDLVAAIQPAMQQLMDSGTLLEIMTTWNLQELALDEATVNAGVN
jgi:polar amino acid transport system substrate-binding protein